MKKAVKKIAYRLRLVLASVLLLGVQALAPVSAFVPTASAAVVCTNDQQGANDEPGQKDLTQMCYDGAGLPTSVAVSWQWDEIAWSGNNTGDGCALFDSDNDGKANYSFCVIVGGNPAAQLAGSPKVYSCNDSRVDRCSGKQLVNKVYTSTCSVTTGTDPFPAGTEFPSDTRASCTINLSDFSTGSAPTNAVLKDVCSYPSQEPNSDPSDCVVTSTNNNTTIELIKQIVPESDSGKFNLAIRKDSSSGSVLKSVPNAQDNYTTGVIEINSGDDVVLEETAGTSTSLSNYNTTLVCVKQNGNQYSFSNSSLTGATRTAEIDDDNISSGDNITCTFTNTRQQATLILQKTVVNDNGGQLAQSNFPVAINGNTAQWGSNSVAPGTFTVSETQQPGYTAGSWGGDCTAQGSVTLTDGQTKTCTIANDDQPGKLIVKKVVVNDNGGTKEADDFSFTVNGGSSTAFEADGQNDITVNVGDYDVAEVAATGYATTYENCEDVAVAIGETETCTITNDDIQPLLTVTKIVTNDNGGGAVVADFPLFVDTTGVTSGVQNGFNAGNYVVSETNKDGYAATITGDCDAQGNVTLSAGDVKSCVITNNDIVPILTVIKYVTNDDGGLLNVSDFALLVGITPVTSGAANPFAAGNYTVSETQQAGYTAGDWGGDCAADGTILLTVGGNYTCTITNDDQPGTLIVKKVVINDDGGTKEEDDFSFTVNGGGTINFEADGQNDLTVAAGDYTVVENPADGYTTTYENCEDVAVANGETETCTVTNDDKEATLTVIKHVITDNGGTAEADDFTMNVTGTSVSDPSFPGDESGTTVSLFPGSYSVDENSYDGYAKTLGENCSGSIELGEHKTCTITNNDIVPILTVIKYVTNDDGGLLGVSDFALFVGITQVTSGVANPFAAGNYTVSETNQPGYTAGNWGGACAADGSITLALGGEYTCTITNNDQPVKIKVTKFVVNNNGGKAEADDFTFKVNDTVVESGVAGFFAGNAEYTISETGLPKGYAQTGIVCEDTTSEEAVASQFTAQLGHNYECVITNDDIAPTLRIVKKTLPGETGQTFDFTSEELDDFNLGSDGEKLFENLQAGSYTVTEETTDGWKLVGLVCRGATYATEDNLATISLEIGDQAVCEFTNEELSVIDGFKFEDTDMSGGWQEGEPTLEGWTITLTEFCLSSPSLDQLVELDTCESAVEDTAVTDENGYYRFENLDSGAYIVCEEIQDGWVATFPLSGYEYNCHFIELGGAGDEQQADFGNFKKATVQGAKFNDINGNHVWDENEPGLEGWEITLTKKCVIVDEQFLSRIAECEDETWTATTDEEGNYSFPNLLPGEYTACETQKDKWAQTFPETEDGCHAFVIDESGQVVVADFGNKAKPQVLGEELVNTGSSATTGLIFGLSILGVTLVTIRRKELAKS